MTEIEPTSRYFTSQRLRLHYLDWGNPAAPTVVLVHGARDHARSWDWVARALIDRWHVVALDLRGHGDSAWSPDGAYAPLYHTCDIAEFVDHLGDERVDIVAHSFGGSLCVRYAAMFPEKMRKLVAIEGIGVSGRDLADVRTRVADVRWREWIDRRRVLFSHEPRRLKSTEDAVRRVAQENTRLSPEQARHIAIHGIRRRDDGSYAWKFDTMVRSSSPNEATEQDQYQMWRAVTCPTLLVWGRESWAVNPEEDGRAGYFPDARVSAYDAAGHWVHHDRLDAFVAEVRGFL